jgi:membrane-associated phospholipid phosphatase
VAQAIITHYVSLLFLQHRLSFSVLLERLSMLHVPYEVYPINPLIKRSLHGKSFPGRHVFSAAVIACSLYIPSPICATITFVLACILAIVRVLGGVHFPRDVIVGLIAGAVCGILGYVILPA